MDEVDHRQDLMMDRNLMVKGRKVYITSVTILDTLQGIIEHLKVRMELIKGGIHLYVSYAINLDTHKDFVEWKE